MFRNFCNKQSGFTLVEVLVSTVLLGVILMVVTAVFADTIKVGKKMLDYQKLADEVRNVTFLIEKSVNQSNGILTNVNTECVENICARLAIADVNGRKVEYSLDLGRIKECENTNDDGTLCNVGDKVEFLTSANIEITDLRFYVKKNVDETGIPVEQPRFTISVEAKPTGGSKIIHAQTTISEKNY